jgi:hypothetical protein
MLTDKVGNKSYLGIEINYDKESKLDKFSLDTLQDRYLWEEETHAQEAFARAAVFGATYKGETDFGLAQRLYQYSSDCWFMFSTPILSNGGTTRGLPISCFLNYVPDSRRGLSDHYDENIWLASSGGGIGFGLSDSIENAEVKEEVILHSKKYHTIYEVKNGLGPAPIKTKNGWLHLAHGVRNTAAGLRYTLYTFMTDLNDLSKIIYEPAGHLIAPQGEERTGDVSNVVFSNGWITDDDGTIFIYYASSDTRLHIAKTSVDRLVDYCMHTKPDGLRSAASVQTIIDLIDRNN